MAKKTAKKTSRRTKKIRKMDFDFIMKKIKDFFNDEKVKFGFSLTSLLFAIYISLAFFSYLFTWQADQSKLDISWFDLMLNANIVLDNWAGKTGAVLADLFIHQWFGVASFSFIFLLVLFGIRMLDVRLLPFFKTLKINILAVIWSSIFLSFIFGDALFLLGGEHGYFMNLWLNAFIGKIGTFFVLLISLSLFVIFTFEEAFFWTKAKFYEVVYKKTIEKPKKTENKKLNQNGVEIDQDFVVVKDEDDPSTDFTFGSPQKTSGKDDLQTTDKKHFTLHNSGKKEAAPELSFEVEEMKQEESKEVKTDEFDLVKDHQIVDKNVPLNDLSLSVIQNSDIQTDQVTELEDYDPTLDLSMYKLPDIELLEDHKASNSKVTKEELLANKNKIVDTLAHYKIKIDKIKATIGPTITLYEIVPSPGVRLSKIKNLGDDIALSLAAMGIRIIAPMPGRGTVGIEVPNRHPEIVSMRSVISSMKYQNSKYELPIALGKTISNESYVGDLTKMPHMLVAGATGQGKSVGLNAILASILYKKHPAQVKFVLIDPKKVELTLYEKIERHFLAKLPDAEEAIITDNQKVIHTLQSLNIEMDNRYNLLKKAFVRNIKEYNAKFISRKLNPEKGHRYMPYIVLVIDEFADLIMTAGKEVELPIARLAQLARAIGIHLIVATQRPSTNIITGVIKANFPTRVAFKVASMIDSRTILDTPGANQLIGRGDMLISEGSELIRIQCAFIDTPELERITDYIGSQQGYPTAFNLPDYETGESEDVKSVDMKKRDELFEDAARIVIMNQQGSTSLIQRKLSIGYNRAGRIIDQLEAAGIVGHFEGSKARKVLYPDEYSLEQYLNSLQE